MYAPRLTKISAERKGKGWDRKGDRKGYQGEGTRWACAEGSSDHWAHQRPRLEQHTRPQNASDYPKRLSKTGMTTR